MKRAQVSPERPGWLARLADPWEEQVLAAAFDAFATRGFDGAAMSEIAAAAGVSKRTIYERYTDKAGLFRALLAWGCRGNLPDADPPADGDPVDALKDHAGAVLAALMRPESIGLFRIVVAATPRFPEVGALFDDMTRSASARIVTVLYRRLKKAGLVAGGTAESFSADFIGLLRGDHFFRTAIGAADPLPQENVRAEARRAMQILLNAYRKA